ncbi:MAG: TfoX/Sxy family protein [Gammaproteobacteria bacterium]|nr:TfoX/Sxy family protein [Gammaproteobacteria bacterium]
MPYNEELAARVAKNMTEVPGMVEKKMFGGIGYMIDGNMSIGTHRDALMVRVGLEAYEDCLAQPGARVMDFTGRVMKGWVTVPVGYAETDEQVQYWIRRSLEFVTTLPPK